MPKVDEVKVLNIGGVPYAVDAMSQNVKRMVELFNEWSQQEADAHSHLMLLQMAKNELSRQIIQQVRKEQEEAKEAQTPKDEPPVENASATTEAPVERAAPVAVE